LPLVLARLLPAAALLLATLAALLILLSWIGHILLLKVTV